MEILFYYEQEKYEKNKPLKNECKLKLTGDHEYLMFTSEFYIEYMRLGNMNYLTYEHGLTVNKKNGDITVSFRLMNKKQNRYKLHKNISQVKKNDFDLLIELSQRGFYSGEKRENFWGVKYKRAIIEIYKLIASQLSISLEEKQYENEHSVNPLYDMIVDYHLNKKNIKGHDNVYWHIMELYPKRKFLKLNENKFLPAILDQLNIKSRYLVGALSTKKDSSKINIKTLKFLCNLFGDNYLDYIKDFNWEEICLELLKSKKLFTCETEAEKKALAKSFKTYSDIDAFVHDGILNTVYDLFATRQFLKDNGLQLKIKGNSCQQLLSLKESWDLHKKHFKLGYKMRYTLPEEMIADLEQPIECNDKIYYPHLILSEDQFKIEGMIMKNCMARQFSVGALYVHAAIYSNKKRINVQYRKGILNQDKGKANINTPKEFKDVIDIFTNRMQKYADVYPEKEKYDIITK